MTSSVVKRQTITANQVEVIGEIMQSAKRQKLKVVDGMETILIYWPGTPFVAMISRISRNVQFYQMGDGHNYHPSSINDYQTADEFFIEAASYKTRLENGEVVREFVLCRDEDDDKYNTSRTATGTEFIVINIATKQSQIFNNKHDIEKYLSCSRVSVDSVLKGRSDKVKGHYIKKVV
jgi:hypothetical protein